MEKTIGDIMIPVEKFTAVDAGDGFQTVVRAYKNSTYPVLLVYDNNLWAGFIGLKDIISTIEPFFLKGSSYRGRKSWSLPVFWEDLFQQRCIEARIKNAGQMMKEVDLQLSVNDPLIKALYGFVKYSTDFLPVAHNDDLVGIVYSAELFEEACSILISGMEAGIPPAKIHLKEKRLSLISRPS
jgi:hypothetical protein